MTDFVRDFLDRYDVPADVKNILLTAKKKLLTEFPAQMDAVFFVHDALNYDIGKSEGLRRAIAEVSGIPFYTVNFVVLLMETERLYPRFLAHGWPEAVFYDTMEDLIYKLRECLTVKGVAGTFVEWWYTIFFRLELVKLGRLEYQIASAGTDYEKDGVTVRKEDKVLSIHIPSAGPLTPELVTESYRMAYDFFPEYRNNGALPVKCSSWLLYPANREIFPDCRNMIAFLGGFDIYSSAETERFNDAWRVFGAKADLPPEELPRDTALRRAIADHLQRGGKMGVGNGFRLIRAE